MLQVKGRAIGSRKPLFADFSVPPPPDLGDGGVQLRDVIESVVRHEVAAFEKRQRDRQFIRVLTTREIAEGEAAGKIDSGGSDSELQDVDVEQAVGTALQAFEDGIYLVVVDEQEMKSLDAQVFLQEESQMTFIRLTMLAGG